MIEKDECDRECLRVRSCPPDRDEELEASETKIENFRECSAQCREAFECRAIQLPLQYSDDVWMILVECDSIHPGSIIRITSKDEVGGKAHHACGATLCVEDERTRDYRGIRMWTKSRGD